MDRGITAAPTDSVWVGKLRERHADVIGKYAQRRLGSPTRARAVVDAVFTRAAGNPVAISGRELPWLIAAARGECARALAGKPSNPAVSIGTAPHALGFRTDSATIHLKSNMDDSRARGK